MSVQISTYQSATINKVTIPTEAFLFEETFVESFIFSNSSRTQFRKTHLKNTQLILQIQI